MRPRSSSTASDPALAPDADVPGDPEEYDELARFCRSFDEAENTEIRVGLREPDPTTRAARRS